MWAPEVNKCTGQKAKAPGVQVRGWVGPLNKFTISLYEARSGFYATQS